MGMEGDISFLIQLFGCALIAKDEMTNCNLLMYRVNLKKSVWIMVLN